MNKQSSKAMIERIGKLEPVRHGVWVRQDETYTRYMCSVCEKKLWWV